MQKRKIKNQHDAQKNREYISETIAKKRQMKKLVDKGIKTFQDKIAELSELKSNSIKSRNKWINPKRNYFGHRDRTAI